MHQLPPKPDSLRVRVWRALQKIGALQLKSSVYVLPCVGENQMKFEAVLEEIVRGKGDAFICRSEFIQGIDRGELVAGFNEDRAHRYQALAGELRAIQKLFAEKSLSENDLMGVEHSLGKLERQMNEIKEMDFFNCAERAPAFKLLDSVVARVEKLRSGSDHHVSKKDRGDYQGKIWVTRENIHVDRVASAWLIERFIDRKPAFKFVGENNYKPKRNEFRFDMFDGEFTHVGDKCTFEVLVESFSIADKGLIAIAQNIHDLDLKDTKYNRPETSGIGLLLRGIVKSEATDEGRMKKAFNLFDDLYQSFINQKARRPATLTP
jgi:hypothetical protein